MVRIWRERERERERSEERDKRGGRSKGKEGLMNRKEKVEKYGKRGG